MGAPEGFTVHRKLERIRERRRTVLDDPEARTIDWAAAEDLAYASLLEDGVPIRLTGEDVERGTFSHRHAVLHDAETGRRHIAAAEAAAGARVVRDPQQPAQRERDRRLRVRLQRAGAGDGSCCGKRSTATSSTARR